MFILNRVSLEREEPNHGVHPTGQFLPLHDGDDGECMEGEVDTRDLMVQIGSA
jgi:hypothetical protein